MKIKIIGGYNKLGEKENVNIDLTSGEIVSIVGPTGAGKSRLLGDIECLAQGDTPTKRHVLIDGNIPDRSSRFSFDNKLVAQLSQNMNFVMDVTVEDFILMHAESRKISDALAVVDKIISCANELAGEQFSLKVPVTQLSGGQSRALMIADTALLSSSPIVLIDEIENAGVDRRKALDILIDNDKIVLMSTHDPLLALMADKRVVIKNGGISKLIYTSEAEKNNLQKLSEVDQRMMEIRSRLRNGEAIDYSIF